MWHKHLKILVLMACPLLGGCELAAMQVLSAAGALSHPSSDTSPQHYITPADLAQMQGKVQKHHARIESIRGILFQQQPQTAEEIKAMEDQLRKFAIDTP